jgi:DNA gyrase subunit B
MSFVNRLYAIDGGTHVMGVKQGIIKALNTTARQYYRDRKPNLQWHNIFQGLTGIVSIMLQIQPNWDGVTKRKLINPEITDIISNLVELNLTQYLQNNIQICQAILFSD